MASSYQVFAVRRFPARDAFVIGEQLNLLADNDHNIEECRTEVTRSAGDALGGALRRMDVFHDFLVQLKYPGRARHMQFREYVTPYKFPLFLSPASAEPFHYALVGTKKKVAHDFVRRMNKEEPGFQLEYTHVDFDCLRPRLTYVKGAWFGSMRAANLSTTGLFGHRVDQSEEFRHAESAGELRNLLVEVVDESELAHSVMVTGDGGIILYRSYQTEDEELAVVQATLTGLLRDCIETRPRPRGASWEIEAPASE